MNAGATAERTRFGHGDLGAFEYTVWIRNWLLRYAPQINSACLTDTAFLGIVVEFGMTGCAVLDV